MTDPDESLLLRAELQKANLEIARRDHAIVLAKRKLSQHDFRATIDDIDQALGLTKEALELLNDPRG
jgi:hypothetical protein